MNYMKYFLTMCMVFAGLSPWILRGSQPRQVVKSPSYTVELNKLFGSLAHMPRGTKCTFEGYEDKKSGVVSTFFSIQKDAKNPIREKSRDPWKNFQETLTPHLARSESIHVDHHKNERHSAEFKKWSSNDHVMQSVRYKIAHKDKLRTLRRCDLAVGIPCLGLGLYSWYKGKVPSHGAQTLGALSGLATLLYCYCTSPAKYWSLSQPALRGWDETTKRHWAQLQYLYGVKPQFPVPAGGQVKFTSSPWYVDVSSFKDTRKKGWWDMIHWLIVGYQIREELNPMGE